MFGVLPIFVILCISATSRGSSTDTPRTGPVQGNGSQPPPLCDCVDVRIPSLPLFQLICNCPDIFSLNSSQDRLYVSKFLTAAPEFTHFTVQCSNRSVMSPSRLFDMLPASVKTVGVNDCFQHYISKDLFFGMSHVEGLFTTNNPSNFYERVITGIYNISTIIPVELDPRLFLPVPQLQSLNLVLLLLDRFPEALYQGIDGTYPLQGLRGLNLQLNNIAYLKPEHLRHLPNLEALYMQYNNIKNCSTSFPFLPSLKTLTLNVNQIRSLDGSPFQNLSGLQSLDLSGQLAVEGQASKVIYLLNSIYVSKNFNFHSKLPVTNLTYNDGVMESIFPTSFLGLSELKFLTLAHSYIKFIPNGTFKGLVKLEQLNISDGLVTHIGESAFQGLGVLKTLDLSYNNLSTIDPSIFESLRSLLSLYLQGNVLQSLSQKTFENMLYLEILNLGNNRLTTFGPIIFRTLVNLRTLDVHGNRLVHLEGLFHGLSRGGICEKVDASYNNVRELDLSFLQNLGVADKTVNVDLSHNNLEILYTTNFYMDKYRPFLSLRLDLRWNAFTSLPFELASYSSFNRSRISIRFPYESLNSYQKGGDISILMKSNRLVCDCLLYELMLHLDVAKQGALYTKTDFQDLECAFPDALSGRKVIDVSPSELWCSEFCFKRPYYLCSCFEHAGEVLASTIPGCWVEQTVCPSECFCSYQGKLHSSTAPYNELVDCAQRDLSSIPGNITNITTILHLEGNQLWVISHDVLPQLLMIRELYLNDNNISYIGNQAFNDLISLQILRLDGNNISEVNSTVFRSLSNLRKLYLNHSGIRYLEADTFQDLASLQELHLENNRLQSLPENMFAGLKKLRLLGIHGNPLKCDCDVLWFTNWLRSRVSLLFQARNVSCLANKKVTRNILSLSSAQLDCDDLLAAQARTRLIVGLSVPLVLVMIILVCVIVLVKRKEAIQVYLYARYGWRFREEEEEDEDKEYDAFLSYSQHDLNVVIHDILPGLENREPPFHVCLHHRDFLPGIPIAENIVNAVNASKRTIILLSNNFLESDWCQLEFQAAHAQMLQDRANRVIVVLLEDIPEENAPPDIQHYLKTNTYLTWGDERFWERLVYAMPRPRHAQPDQNMDGDQLDLGAQNVDGDQLALVELDHNA
ncbi:toll-like receptor Tollo [Branchiostoma lanceolatum]|uniref:toll-like receptor Tollo n=1 Tax=Branchiostoma lanceolatum TaxID=7740 RepID=UPI00345475A5